ncbi:MAG: phage tail tape measure protein [Prevotellaceae bacterium]|nr:phage tail tape measure protein [Prevotellaceae bacterium]MDY3857005.1 phage tail tape measure protein [Bacteroidaceae bacterium]
MAKEIKFNVRISIDGKEQLVTATSTVQDLRRVMDSTKDSAGKLRESLINYNQAVQMMQSVTNAVSQLSNTLNSVTEESRTFGAAMKAANTMAGKDAEGFAKLKDQVAELSETIPMARDQLANGLYQVISNGVPEDNWISYLQASAKSAVGGIADVGEVVKVTSTIIKNYGLEWSAAQDIQDKIQLTAKNGVTSFEQLAAALPSVTGQAAQLGVSFTEMLAVMSTLTGVTGNTSEVATQLSSVLTALTKESAKSQKMAEAMGISFNAASIKAAGGLRNYLQELDKTVTAYAAKTGENLYIVSCLAALRLCARTTPSREI